MELLQAAFFGLVLLFLAAMNVFAAFILWQLCSAIKKAQNEAEIQPAATGGPRPKPASDEPDMQAQATGGPRPKV